MFGLSLKIIAIIFLIVITPENLDLEIDNPTLIIFEKVLVDETPTSSPQNGGNGGFRTPFHISSFLYTHVCRS